MTERGTLPAALLRELERDHRPVRPLRPVTRRVLVVAVWALALLAVVLPLFGLRADARALGLALGWGAAALECVAGVALAALALREAVPGAGVALPWRLAALLGGVSTQVLVATACWVHSGRPASSFPPGAATCLPLEGALGIPALVITLILVGRAYAVRPRWAGVLGGAGAGLVTDGVWHLICPHADLAHVLVLHGGAVLLLAAAGWLAGAAAEALRRGRLAGRP